MPVKNAPAAPPRASIQYLLAGGGLIVVVAVLGSILLGLWGPNAASGGPVKVAFSTEQGQAANTGVSDSPLTVSAHITRPDGSPEVLLVSANVQLLDDAGKPATYGGKAGDPAPMHASPSQGVWEYNGSVPSEPGTYHARVQWQALPANDATPTAYTHTLELAEPRLTVSKAGGPPLTSGFVFARDANLWLMSTDTTRQRRLTFYPSYYEYADNAVWSPDGKLLAYAYSPRVASNEIPATHIWTIRPDGTGAKQVVEHGQDESVYEPAWSKDGKSLYYTLEKSDNSSTLYDAVGAPIGEREIDKIDLATGTRARWMPQAEQPSCCDPQNRLAYLENTPSQDPSGGVPPGQRLEIAPADGSGKSSVLVDAGAFQMMYAPAISPDGKWVAFAAINVPPPPKGEGGFDFLRWLLFIPDRAYAHGLPWDLYLVPTSGGATVQLTNLSEDQPYPVWMDNSTLTFMGVRGMYKLQLGPDGKPQGEPIKIHDGAPHGGLTWRAP